MERKIAQSCCVFAPISRNGSSLHYRSQTLIFALMCIREHHAEAIERPCWSRTPLTSLTLCQECEDTLTYSRGRVLEYHGHRLHELHEILILRAFSPV